MPEKDDANWAGKGFTKRNEESAPEPKPKPKLRIVRKPKPEILTEQDDVEAWLWQ